MEPISWWIQQQITTTTKVLLELLGWECVEKFKGSIFMHGVLGKLWVLAGALLHFAGGT